MNKPIAILLGATVVAGCGAGGTKTAKSSNAGAATIVTAASRQAVGHPSGVRFATRVDNEWFPLRPGTTLTYRGVKDGQTSRDVFTVTHATKTIDGVSCTVVSDRLYLKGKLEERTTDWYAQDTTGNVWYFGEATAELDTRGRVKNTQGSWQAGVKGARAGIFMPAHPRVGQSGLQEYFKGQAEDHFRVLSLAASVRTPAAASRRALLTEEWTPLEPAVRDHKLYVRGIGTVLEQTVKGGDERNTLVAVQRG
jgi:hypothetical protein